MELRKARIAGTLIVVSIGIIVCLRVSLGFRRARCAARMMQILGNGRGIYTCLFAADMDTSAAPEERGYPSTKSYANSTEYFRAMVERGILDVDFSFFSAPGIFPALDGEFTSQNNAWCVMADIPTNAPSSLPVLFTRNLHFTNASGRVKAYLSDEPPFGKKGAVVVFWGGSAARIQTGTLDRVDQVMPLSRIDMILRP